MALVKHEYAPSKTLYAFDFSDIEINYREAWSPTSYATTSWSVRAIWTKTTKGVTFISYGRLHESFRDVDYPVITPADFLAEVDMRYGGTADVKWDGTYVHAPKTPFAEIQETVQKINPWLEALPALPSNFDGWYISS